MQTYKSWLAERSASTPPIGLVPSRLSDAMFGYQKSLTEWALRRGRAALFADTGLGKTLMQLEWAREVSEQAGRVLILAPLAVSDQTVREGERFGVDVDYVREDNGAPIVITNYEMLDRFDPSMFSGIVLDESSILKSYTGSTRNAIITSFRDTPFRLACTATPAPNDHMELGNHSEFLGVKSRTEMLSEYFVHDGGSTQSWRLKGHAEDLFWRWVCGWASVIKRPSDMGYSDEGFILPPLNMGERIVAVNHRDAWSEGYLFKPEAVSLSEQRATRRMTMAGRVELARDLAHEKMDEPVLVWCELNKEGDMLTAAIDGAIQVRGSDSPEVKAERLLGFAAGKYRALVTKPSIAGFGMNWQHCARMIFVGASHSYEQTYQAIRRCWRFGQKRPVDVWVIRAETEGAIIRNFRRKEADAERMASQMIEHMRDTQRSRGQASQEWTPYEPKKTMQIPKWAGGETQCTS